MKFSFMQNPLTQIQFYAWIYNSFINSHLLEWLKVRQIKSGIRVNFDQCDILIEIYLYIVFIKLTFIKWSMTSMTTYIWKSTDTGREDRGKTEGRQLIYSLDRRNTKHEYWILKPKIILSFFGFFNQNKMVILAFFENSAF